MSNILRACSVVLAMVLWPILALGQTTWTGAAGDNIWSTAGNWSSGVPTATVDATIPAGAGTITITNAANVRNLTTARPLLLSVCGSQLIISGDLTLTGVNITSNVTGCSALSFIRGTSLVAATQNIFGTGEIIAQSNASITLSTRTTLNIASGITIRADAANFSFSQTTASVVNNAGVLRSSGSSRTISTSGTIDTANPANSSQFNNTGSVLIDTNATFTLSSVQWTNTGTFSVASGGTLNLNGRYATLGAPLTRSGSTTVNFGGVYTGSTFQASNATGPAIIRFDSTNVTFSAIDGQTLIFDAGTHTTPTITSPFQITGFVSTTSPAITANGTWTQCGSQLAVTSGNLTLTGATLSVGTSGCTSFTFTQGTSATPAVQGISGTGTIIGTGSMSFNVGTRTTLNIASGITIRSDSGTTSIFLNSGAVLNNAGTIRATGSNRTVSFGGVLDAANPANNSQLNNTGTMTADNGGIITINSNDWTNTGTFSLDSGATFNLNGRWSTLGTITRTGTTTLNLGGIYLGASLTASPSTGPIVFNSNTSGLTFSTTGGATLTISGGTHLTPTFNSPVTISGSANMTSPVFNADATIPACGGQIVVSSGNLTLNNANLNINSQSCQAVVFSQGTLAVPASQSILGTGELIATGSALLAVNAHTTLTISPNITLRADAANWTITLTTASGLINNGTLRSSGAFRSIGLGGSLDTATPANNSTFTNNASVRAENGATFSIGNVAWTNPGTFVVGNNGTLTLNGRWGSLGTLSRTGTTTVTAGGIYTGATFVATDALGLINFNANTTNCAFSSTGSAQLTLSGGTHASPVFNSPATITGSISASSPTFNASATFPQCGAAIVVTSGNLTLNNANLSSNGQGCSVYTFNQGTFVTSATQGIVGTGEIISIGSSTTFITIGAYTTLNIATGVTVRADAALVAFSLSTATVLNNSGTIRTTGMNRSISITGAFDANNAANSSTFNNLGSVIVGDNALLSITTLPWTNTGSFTLGNASTLNLGGRYSALGTINRQPTSIVALTGTFTGSAFAASSATGNLNVGATFTNTTFTTANGATITFTGGTHIAPVYNSPTIFSGTVTIQNGATFNADASFPICGGGLTISSGNLTLNNATFTANPQGCNWILFNQGTMALPATQSIAGTGTLRSTASATISGSIGTTINVQPNITIEQTAGNLIFPGSNGLVVDNQGTIRSVGSTANITLGQAGSTVSNAGSIVGESQSLITTRGPINSSGVISLATGARLGNESNISTINLSPTSTLRFISSGPSATTSIGRVVITNSGTLNVGGTLEVVVTGSDVCRQTTRIVSILPGSTTGQINGSFATTTFPPPTP
ncbi:MAG: hypothetical protein MUE97_03745, partial [Phycisphaerales bacterium]|nr:hypothetical protein [Phycisphaerales bacterium]